jgi:hypothetical protein
MDVSSSALTAAYVTMLGAASAFGSDAVGEDYSVLESASGVAVVVQWTGLESEPQTMTSWGRTTRRNVWTMTFEMFSKDTNDPAKIIADRKRMVDVTMNVLLADETAQGLADRVRTIRAARTPGEARVAGGALWSPATLEAEVEVWEQ